MKKDLLDDELFGNDAGEDESRERLAEYYLEKSEYESFFSDKRHIAFVRARKGVGKSALLSYANYKLDRQYPKSLFVFVKASELIQICPLPESGSSSLEYSNYWQQCLCTRIAIEIGRTIKFATNDDSMTFVETAELTGFKGKNIVSALSERFKNKLDKLAPEKLFIQNPNEILKRYSSDENINVWFFIDDIDATFINTSENRMLVSTFFSACRNIVNTVKGIYIRASVRTDIWAIIKSEDESLDKCEQYMIDLKWSTEDTGQILANKVLSYFTSTYPNDAFISECKALYPHSRKQVFGLVFSSFTWGTKRVEPYIPIHILSAGRPRWAAQLCKMAAKDAYKNNTNIIHMGDINNVMFEYGKSRLSDLYKEHGHQCNNLKHIIESFRDKKKMFTTKTLSEFIEEILTDPLIENISIDNSPVKNPLEIARFLYRIGFITLDDNSIENDLSYIRFEDIPDLLIPANLRNDDKWIVHPAYRKILHLS